MADETENIPLVHQQVRTEIKDQTLSDGLHADVIDLVKEHFVSITVEKRKGILVKGFEALKAAEKEVQRFKPDQVTVDENGKEISSAFSKPKFEELKKLREKEQKIRTALEAALSKKEFDKLTQVLGDK